MTIHIKLNYFNLLNKCAEFDSNGFEQDEHSKSEPRPLVKSPIQQSNKEGPNRKKPQKYQQNEDDQLEDEDGQHTKRTQHKTVPVNKQKHSQNYPNQYTEEQYPAQDAAPEDVQYVQQKKIQKQQYQNQQIPQRQPVNVDRIQYPPDQQSHQPIQQVSSVQHPNNQQVQYRPVPQQVNVHSTIPPSVPLPVQKVPAPIPMAPEVQQYPTYQNTVPTDINIAQITNDVMGFIYYLYFSGIVFLRSSPEGIPENLCFPLKLVNPQIDMLPIYKSLPETLAKVMKSIFVIQTEYGVYPDLDAQQMKKTYSFDGLFVRNLIESPQSTQSQSDIKKDAINGMKLILQEIIALGPNITDSQIEDVIQKVIIIHPENTFLQQFKQNYIRLIIIGGVVFLVIILVCVGAYKILKK